MDIMIYINDYINNLYKRLLLTFRDSQLAYDQEYTGFFIFKFFKVIQYLSLICKKSLPD